MPRRLRVSVLPFLALLLAATARADTPPSVWDMARDPTVRDRYALHVNVRESIQLERENGGHSSSIPHASPLVRARVLLELEDAEHKPDMLLRFDLGEVYALLKEYNRAIAVLKPALESAPDHPAALDALNSLANAYANLDRSAEEREVYERFLSRATDERSRAVAILNLAEAEMHLGELTESIADYREAVQVATSLPNVIELETNTGVLAVWGLAVALDRSGDESGGAAQTKLAEQLDPNDRIIGQSPNVFFVPAYERLWYLALGATERARRADTAKEASERWGRVEALWAKYVDEADKQKPKDRWILQAKRHRERATAQRIAAQKRAALPLKAPPALPWTLD